MAASNYVKDAVLNHLFDETDIGAVPTAWYVQCHTGAPGGACTSNVSTAFASRVECTGWATSSAGAGATSNSAAVLFETAGGAETITHISIWDASTSGNALASGALAAEKAVEENDDLNFAIGEIDVTLA